MREIIFRGQNINREWAYGLLSQAYEKIGSVEPGFYISNKSGRPWAFQIRPETIGQYTGLKDKNGKMIFEGDIVKTEIDHIGDIQFDSGIFGIEWVDVKEDRGMVGGWGQVHNLRRIDDDFNKKIEIIGNIYDNPELLNGGFLTLGAKRD